MDTRQTTRFGLVRHAETLWNREKRIQGQSDSALTPEGKRDADNWGRQLSRFSWDAVLVSDTGRALETANRMNHHLQTPLESDLRLREQDWGRWTGCLIAQVEKEASRNLPAKQKMGWNFCPPGGEKRLDVWQRSQNALIEAARKWRGKAVLIVTHEGVIKSMIYHLSGRRFLAGEPDLIKPYHLHWLVYTAGVIKIDKLNALKLL
jgi:broad specificity phosphatase PhoE